MDSDGGVAAVVVGVDGDVVGIAVAIEVPHLAARAAEAVAVVMARVDDHEERHAREDGGERERDGEVEAEIAVDAGAALDRDRQGAVPLLRRQEARAGVSNDPRAGPYSTDHNCRNTPTK